MKIKLDRIKKEFYLHLTDSSFTATRDGVCILFTREELEKLVAFGNAEIQDALISEEADRYGYSR